ncbi:MAG: alanine racemase [Comamonas sp.]|nr:alanine racemase [Comamonas sp.]
MTRPLLATIDPQAMRHNLQRVRQAVGDARIWAVVKANAYGHGLAAAYEGLRGADGFAVLLVQEAQQLRQLGWRGPIVLLEGVFEARELEACSRLGLSHVVHCDAQIDWLAAHKSQLGQHVLLKMNSGMNRLGFAPERYRSAYARLSALPQVEAVDCITHFSQADSPMGASAQLAIFNTATADLAAERSLSNSAASLLQPQGEQPPLHSDWVRPGIVLYGASPDYPQHSAQDWGLEPAMSLHSRLIAVQHLAVGAAVGYGNTFIAPEPMRLGVVACGYGDGYPRHCATGTPILVDGVRTQVIGRVSMDMLCVDLRPVPQADFGSEVLLWGRSPRYGSLLSVDEVAAAAGTIGYELLCALAPRVPVQTMGATA